MRIRQACQNAGIHTTVHNAWRQQRSHSNQHCQHAQLASLLVWHLPMQGASWREVRGGGEPLLLHMITPGSCNFWPTRGFGAAPLLPDWVTSAAVFLWKRSSTARQVRSASECVGRRTHCRCDRWTHSDAESTRRAVGQTQFTPPHQIMTRLLRLPVDRRRRDSGQAGSCA